MNKTEQINTKYIYMKYFYQKIALLKKLEIINFAVLYSDYLENIINESSANITVT